MNGYPTGASYDPSAPYNQADGTDTCSVGTCGEYTTHVCDVCNLPCCRTHSKVIVDGPVKDHCCMDCLAAIRKMEAK